MNGSVPGYGGVYKAMNVEKETMSAAKKAAQDAIFDDASLKSEAETRKERNTALYIPTFFTGVPQETLHPVAAAHADRFQRDANVSTYLFLYPNNIIFRIYILSLVLLFKFKAV